MAATRDNGEKIVWESDGSATHCIIRFGDGRSHLEVNKKKKKNCVCVCILCVLMVCVCVQRCDCKVTACVCVCVCVVVVHVLGRACVRVLCVCLGGVL